MRATAKVACSALLALLVGSAVRVGSAQAVLRVTAQNRLDLPRPSETVSLQAPELLARLGQGDLRHVHIREAGREIISQAVDSDGDGKTDELVFQADFGPGETKTFELSVGAPVMYTRDRFRVYGRFVRERFDDFAWENDRIAHRTYGKGLETWAGEPLSSSTIDIWSKRTSRLVINDWYLTDNYHADAGEGADFYSAGTSRGDGGSGLWADNRLWVSRSFVESRALANGPIRVMFELTYEPFDVNGISVAEVKRVTLDAGRNFDHYRSTYKPFTRPGQSVPLTAAIGLKKVNGEQVEFNAAHGWLAKWEKVEKNAGNQGLAILLDPGALEKQAEDRLNLLVLTKVPANNEVNWWAGFCWDKAGHITTADAWKKYVDEFAQGLALPIEVSVSAP